MATLVSGAFATGDPRGPTALDRECPVCGADMNGEYEDGVVTLACESDDDHGVGNLVPPGAARGRRIDELVETMRVVSYHDIAQTVQDICPACRGSFEWSLRSNADGETGYVGTCTRCPMMYTDYGGMLAATDPAVVSFFHDHGLDVRERATDLSLAAVANREIVSREPPRVAITFTAAGQQLRVVLDETAQVIETSHTEA